MTRQYDNYADLITFSRSSGGTALRPISYGDELVTNGTFDSNLDSWNLIGGTASQVDGEAVITYDGGNGGLAQYVSVTVGKVYRVTGEIISATSPSPRFKIGSTNLGNDYAQYTATGSIDTVVVATTSTISVFGQSLTSGSIIIDNISVKEVLFDQPNAPLTLFNHPAGIPRIEYDADGDRLGLLIEESRTNLVTYSEDFSGSDWTLGASTLNLSAAASPSGSSSYQLTSTGSAAGHILDNIALTASASATASVFIKNNSSTRSAIGLYSPLDSSWFGRVDFDWVDGTPVLSGTVNAVGSLDSYSFTETGDGWWRVTVTVTTNTNTSARIYIYPDRVSGTESVYIWGAQVEQGSFPTSYIPTSGATATRSADVASIPVADFGYNQSEGTLFAEVRAEDTDSSSGNPFYEIGTATSDYIRLDRYSGGFAFRVRANNVTTVNAAIPGGEPNTTDFHKVSASYLNDDFAYTYNGNTLGTDSSGTVPSVINTLDITDGTFNGHIKSIKYFPRKLSAAQLQELTT